MAIPALRPVPICTRPAPSIPPAHLSCTVSASPASAAAPSATPAHSWPGEGPISPGQCCRNLGEFVQTECLPFQFVLIRPLGAAAASRGWRRGGFTRNRTCPAERPPFLPGCICRCCSGASLCTTTCLLPSSHLLSQEKVSPLFPTASVESEVRCHLVLLTNCTCLRMCRNS